MKSKYWKQSASQTHPKLHGFDFMQFWLCFWQNTSTRTQAHLPILSFPFFLHNQTLVLRVQIKPATLTQALPETVPKSFQNPVPNIAIVIWEVLWAWVCSPPTFPSIKSAQRVFFTPELPITTALVVLGSWDLILYKQTLHFLNDLEAHLLKRLNVLQQM